MRRNESGSRNGIVTPWSANMPPRLTESAKIGQKSDNSPSERQAHRQDVGVRRSRGTRFQDDVHSEAKIRVKRAIRLAPTL